MLAQVPACARLAQEAVASGMCAVIGLQSTGEANTKASAELDDVMDDFISAPQVVLTQFLLKQFPVTMPKDMSRHSLQTLLGMVGASLHVCICVSVFVCTHMRVYTYLVCLKGK